MLSSFTNWGQSTSTELLILFCTEEQLHLKNKEQIYLYIYIRNWWTLLRAWVNLRVPSCGFFMDYQVGRDLMDDPFNHMSEESLWSWVAFFASQDLSQESNNRKRKGLFLSPSTHPDLPLALDHKPGRICELSLLLGKGWDTAGDLLSLARQRWFCQPLIQVSACSLPGWWLHFCELGTYGMELIAW